MPDNTAFVHRILAPYGPRLPVEQMAVEVNRLYHAKEARSYDGNHAEIHEQLPPIWADMIAEATRLRPGRQWRVLDFGCGTGFEALQILRGLPPGCVRALTCYDPCAEMLERCRSRVAPLMAAAQFTTRLDDIEPNGLYDLLITNSLLHHLPDPYAALRDVEARLSADALWLAGHEPSNRYYRNQECLGVLRRYARARRLRALLSPRKVLGEAMRIIGRGSTPAHEAAREAFRLGYFESVPTAKAIDRLVDFHVAHSAEEATDGRGFDVDVMQASLRGGWRLAWVRTYSFLGSYYEGRLPARWRRSARALATKYPLDGANFSMLWERL